MTEDEARLVDPADLIGAQEVLTICGWKTRKSIGDHEGRGFPAPVAVTAGYRLWLRTEVEEWAKGRKP